MARKNESAGAALVRRAKVSFTPTAPPRPDKAGQWQWMMRDPDRQWVTNMIPPGDVCSARVQRTLSKNGVTGKYGYCGYRSGELLGMRDTWEEAAKMVERGKPDPRKDNVTAYVDHHPTEIPPFLALTQEERSAVRAQYPYAAPSVGAVARAEGAGRRGVLSAADPSDLGTRALLRDMAEKESAKAGHGGPGRVAPLAKNKTVSVPQGKLSRLRDGNPKKAGSGAWKRWETLFAACVAGSAVKAYEAQGGNMETLANALRMGYVKVEEVK